MGGLRFFRSGFWEGLVCVLRGFGSLSDVWMAGGNGGYAGTHNAYYVKSIMRLRLHIIREHLRRTPDVTVAL